MWIGGISLALAPLRSAGRLPCAEATRASAAANSAKPAQSVNAEICFMSTFPAAALTACIANGGHQILDVLLVFKAGLVQDAVPDLTLEHPLRSKWLHEKYRIVVSGQ